MHNALSCVMLLLTYFLTACSTPGERVRLAVDGTTCSGCVSNISTSGAETAGAAWPKLNGVMSNKMDYGFCYEENENYTSILQQHEKAATLF